MDTESGGINMNVNIAGLALKNPVIAASGTFGFGREYSNYIDLSRFGGIAVKGLTLLPRQGNKPPRVAETSSGMLNSVGLQNPGAAAFVQKELPFLRKFDTKVIANIAGDTFEDYEKVADIVCEGGVDAVEVNVSCPNVKHGGASFGNNTADIAEVTKRVKKRANVPVFVKLTPNVTDIKELARAAEAAGADALTLINTIYGLAIDVHRRRPILGANFGGLSGPAVKPVALRMVYETAQTVKVPVIGMGGIVTGEDAVEFLLAGASAIMVGTANFMDPTAGETVTAGIRAYMERYKVENISDLVGKLQLN